MLHLLYHLQIDTYTGSINQPCDQGALSMDVQVSLLCVGLAFRYIHRKRSRAGLSYNKTSQTQKVEYVCPLLVRVPQYTQMHKATQTGSREDGHQQEERRGEEGEMQRAEHGYT